MKSTFGNLNCHFLQINSISPSAARETGMGEQANLPDPWSQFVRRKPEADLTVLYTNLGVIFA